ncbi:MAG: toll/interleukin-1 receptor domain-containing protein [Clostridia bacterium]|nr:toll/interleukin-1 receptor domain-containing protein [Clostridia bacterium]
MYNEKLSVFLSHSHKDVEKVRRIRDVLETLDCEPIIFFLKCLDDDNPNLEDFIKQEIAARNVFLYCKSKNSEESIWVQKEIEYIKSLDKSRLYTVDLEQGFAINLIEVLQSILYLINRNTVIICCSEQDKDHCEKIAQALNKIGYVINFYHPQLTGIPSMKSLKDWEYTKLHDQYAHYFDTEIIPQMKKIMMKGTVLVMDSKTLFDGDWSSYMMGKFLNWCKTNNYNVVHATLQSDFTEIVNAINKLSI